MEKVTIIGQGKVATHLCIALAGKVEELVNISSREPEEIPTDSDIYIIAVSDNAIEQVVTNMPEVAGIVAHTAGSISIDVIRNRFKRAGVFYPLQTFTKGAYLDYSEIPVFVEGADISIEGQLLGLASLFTPHLYKADSARREKLHIASVFACNFTNHLWHISESILKDAGYGIDVLLPLIGAAADKLKYMSAQEAQTGPASRNDTQVIDRHLTELADTPYKELYAILTSSIIKSMKI